MSEQIVAEEWRSVVGYDGWYEVSDWGNVRRSLSSPKTSSQSVPGRILKKSINFAGYFVVSLCRDGTIRSVLVHRLVATAFIENPLGFPEVNHKNGVKTESDAGNLEWCTRKQNAVHAFNTGLAVPNFGEENGQSKLTRIAVMDIRTRLDKGQKQKDIAKIYGICQSNVSRIGNTETWRLNQK